MTAGPNDRRVDASGRWKSESVRRLMLLVGSVAFFFFLVELPALIGGYDYKGLLGLYNGWWPMLEIGDRELLQVRPPYAHLAGSATGGSEAYEFRVPPSDLTHYRWDAKYDHNGFRNPVDLKRADIAVIGDSFVEGLTVTDAQLTTSLLAHLQGKVVANLGHNGFGPQQELIVLKRYGLPLRPSTIIWMFFEGNDLVDVEHYERRLRSKPPSFWAGFRTRSFTQNAYWAARRIWRDPRTPSANHACMVQTANGKMVTVYFSSTVSYSASPLDQRSLADLDEAVRSLAAAHQLCAAQGSRFVFVYIPDKFRVFRESCRFPPESWCRSWVVNNLPERMRNAVGTISAEVGYLDLTPVLMDAVRRGVLPYFPDDLHWSPEGHEIAAEAIHDFLVRTGDHAY